MVGGGGGAGIPLHIFVLIQVYGRKGRKESFAVPTGSDSRDSTVFSKLLVLANTKGEPMKATIMHAWWRVQRIIGDLVAVAGRKAISKQAPKKCCELFVQIDRLSVGHCKYCT